MSAVIRKIVTVVEETYLEMGQTVAPPTRRAAAIAVIENPDSSVIRPDILCDEGAMDHH